MSRNLLMSALALSLAVTAPVAAQALTCPSVAEVSASFTKWHTNYQMAPTNVFLYKIKGVSGFQFGQMKFGSIIKSQVEWGQAAQDVCPVRVEYTFVIEGQDGSRSPQKKGVNETSYFYKNGFDEWIFKTSAN